MKKKSYLLITFIVVVIIGVGYYNYDQKQAKEVESKILSFQKTYHNYIDKKDILSEEELDALFKNDLFKTSKLNDYYKAQQANADTSISAIIQTLEYDYNFLKIENTKHYQTKNKDEYNKIIKENEAYFKKIKNEDDFALFDKVKANNALLLEIVMSELLLDEEVNKAYLDGLNNVNTSNLLLDNCFNKQTNLVWKLEPEISQKYCESLKLIDCKLEGINKDTNEFIGYTMNNPKLINKELSYEYLSLHKNDFQGNDQTSKLINTKDHKVHVEVYSRSVNNHNLYKYNISLIKSDYVLECKTPTP